MGRKFPLLVPFSYLCQKSYNKGGQLWTTMEKKEEKVQEQPKKSKMEELDEEAKKQGKKVSKTWEAAMRLKGSLIVNDPTFLL